MQPAQGNKVQKKKPDPPKEVGSFQDPDAGRVEERLNRSAKSDRRDNYGQITVLDHAAQTGTPFVNAGSVDSIGRASGNAGRVPPNASATPPSSVSSAPEVPPPTASNSTSSPPASQEATPPSSPQSDARRPSNADQAEPAAPTPGAEAGQGGNRRPRSSFQN